MLGRPLGDPQLGVAGDPLLPELEGEIPAVRRRQRLEESSMPGKPEIDRVADRGCSGAHQRLPQRLGESLGLPRHGD